MYKELKACPFCGSYKQSLCSSGKSKHWLVCHNCGADGPTSRTKHGAIAAWNKRVTEEKAG